MSLLIKVSASLCIALICAGAYAQDREPAEDPPEVENPEPQPAPDPDDVFIPSEEIPADEEVTFPVNI